MEEPPSEEPAAAAPVAQVAPAPEAPRPGIGFHNRAAVRAAFLSALLASLLISLPMPIYIAFFWLLVGLVSAGFVSVYLYSRRTGEMLNVRGGARIGWITGVFCFLIATIFFTLSVISIARQKGLVAFYRDQLSARSSPEVNLDQLLQILETPAGMAMTLLFTLLLVFVMFTLLPTLGGALGAKVLEKD